MSERPTVIPLYPQRPVAEEAERWRAVFAWIAEHPPVDFRRSPTARALIAAADQFIAPIRQRRGA